MRLTKKQLKHIARNYAYYMLLGHAESPDTVNQYRDYEQRLDDNQLKTVSEELTRLADKIGVLIGEDDFTAGK